MMLTFAGDYSNVSELSNKNFTNNNIS